MMIGCKAPVQFTSISQMHLMQKNTPKQKFCLGIFVKIWNGVIMFWNEVRVSNVSKTDFLYMQINRGGSSPSSAVSSYWMVPFYLKAFKDSARFFSSSCVVYAVVFLPFETAVNVDLLVILITLHCNTDNFLGPTLKFPVMFKICLFVCFVIVYSQ